MRRPPRRRPSKWKVSDVDMLETKGDNRDRAAETTVGLRQWKVIPSSTAPISDARQRRAKNSTAKASEIFSAIMIVGRLVLAHGIVGMTEASQI
jgi:hypothetical protein